MADKKIQVFSNVGSQGQGQGYQTIQDVIKDIGGATGTVERLYFKDPETGRVFNYDYDDAEFEGLGPGYYGKSLDDLQLVSGFSKNRNDETVSFQVDDPNKYDVSGITGYDPETAEAMRQETLKDDPSDNDIFYTAPNGEEYVDTTGTGQGIPVGSTNIHRKGAIETPKLEKTYDGYQAMGTSTKQELLDTVPKSGSFLNAFKLQEMGGKPFDLGELLGMRSGQLVFSNPPSNQTNLESFFNNVQDVGGIENFLRSSQDKLGLLKKYGFDLIKGTAGDLLPLDQANINNTLNEYLSGTTASDDSSTTFGDSFNKISSLSDSSGNSPITSPSTSEDTTTSLGPQRQAFIASKPSDFSILPEIPKGPRTFTPDPRLDPIFPQYGQMPTPVNPTPIMPSKRDFKEVMANPATVPAGMNPYFEGISAINQPAPVEAAQGGGISSLNNRMLQGMASPSMYKGIMS